MSGAAASPSDPAAVPPTQHALGHWQRLYDESTEPPKPIPVHAESPRWMHVVEKCGLPFPGTLAAMTHCEHYEEEPWACCWCGCDEDQGDHPSCPAAAVPPGEPTP